MPISLGKNQLIAKTQISDLAFFGGAPMFPQGLLTGKPSSASVNDLLPRFAEILERGWLTNDGPLVQELERRCAQFLGVGECIAVVNATVGLQLAAFATGMADQPGGEVLVPSFTFVGTAHALQWIGLKPIFCDVDPTHHCLTAAEIRKRMTAKTVGIMGVQLWGRAGDSTEISQLAQEFGIPVIYDAAHAFGCYHEGKPIGLLGDVSVFSLHATKVMHSVEGGLLTTNNRSLADKLRRLRNYGFYAEDRVAHLGTNAKMHEFSAAFGLTNLESLPQLIEHNRNIQAAYHEELNQSAGIRLLTGPAANGPANYHYAILEVSDYSALTRDSLRSLLLAESIGVRRYFQPGCHRQLPYSQQTEVPQLPVTEQLSRNLLQLPTGWQISPEQARHVSQLINYCQSQAAQINKALSATTDKASG